MNAYSITIALLLEILLIFTLIWIIVFFIVIFNFNVIYSVNYSTYLKNKKITSYYNLLFTLKCIKEYLVLLSTIQWNKTLLHTKNFIFIFILRPNVTCLLGHNNFYNTQQFFLLVYKESIMSFMNCNVWVVYFIEYNKKNTLQHCTPLIFLIPNFMAWCVITHQNKCFMSAVEYTQT